jgi:hypothetical protein
MLRRVKVGAGVAALLAVTTAIAAAASRDELPPVDLTAELAQVSPTAWPQSWSPEETGPPSAGATPGPSGTPGATPGPSGTPGVTPTP